MKKLFLLLCLIFVLPSCKYQSIEVDVVLLNKVIFIDAGHGGKDNGCVFENVYEDEINLSIASYLYEKCYKDSFLTYLTRSNDYDLASLYSQNRKNEDLQKRVKAINKSGCDLFISIHLNSYANHNVHGPMVYYQKSNDDSKYFADILQNNMNAFAGVDKKTHVGDYYILNKSKKTGILIECGFLSNHEERKRLMDKIYQQELARVIFNSICTFFSC